MTRVPQIFLDILVGLSPEEAVKMCERAGLRVRIIKDGWNHAVPTRDYGSLRVNLEVENKIVRKAGCG